MRRLSGFQNGLIAVYARILAAANKQRSRSKDDLKSVEARVEDADSEAAQRSKTKDKIRDDIRERIRDRISTEGPPGRITPEILQGVLLEIVDAIPSRDPV
jgi:hypothetical protein